MECSNCEFFVSSVARCTHTIYKGTILNVHAPICKGKGWKLSDALTQFAMEGLPTHHKDGVRDSS
jgi:hypothetical protein